MRSLACVLAAIAGASVSFSQAPATREAMEEFLRTAKVGPQRTIDVGVTGSRRATLTKGGFRHDAHIQTVNISRKEFQTDRGIELNFVDSYRYNIAAYRLDRLLGLDMMPVSVERKIGGSTAAVTWWVPDVIMMELDRHKKKIGPPDMDAWNRQMCRALVFNELIYDNDPNRGNFLIDRNWKLWMVDKTRAFRLYKTLREPKNLVKCDRQLLAALRKLDRESLARETARYLKKAEIEGVLARRDRIVELFERRIREEGEAAVLFDAPGETAAPAPQAP